MSMVKNVRGVLVEKSEKSFSDGTKGTYCTILVQGEPEFIGFWASAEVGELLPEEVDCESFRDDLARDYSLKVRFFDGKKKYSLVDVN